VRILHNRSDIRSIAFVGLTLAAYVVEWSGAFRHPLLCMATCCLAFLACTINHNHQHHPTFVNRPLNRGFSLLLTLAAGMPATAIVAMHNDNHHLHNNQAADFLRASRMTFRWNLLNVLLLPIVAIAEYAPVRGRELQAWRTHRPALHRQVRLERWAFYSLLLTLTVLQPLPTVIYIFLPQLFGQWGILAINHIQHDGCDPDSAYNHSRNFVGGWLNWWVFNNGYHTAHHLRPGLHWSELPRYHAEIRCQIDPALECRSFLWTVVQFYIWPARRPVLKGISS
jgi:fatty acid desaturase